MCMIDDVRGVCVLGLNSLLGCSNSRNSLANIPRRSVHPSTIGSILMHISSKTGLPGL